MAKHLIMDQTGHSTIEFDKADPAALREANERFERLLAEGHTAATRKAGEADYSVVKRVDQQQDETLFARPLVGG